MHHRLEFYLLVVEELQKYAVDQVLSGVHLVEVSQGIFKHAIAVDGHHLQDFQS